MEAAREKTFRVIVTDGRVHCRGIYVLYTLYKDFLMKKNCELNWDMWVGLSKKVFSNFGLEG